MCVRLCLFNHFVVFNSAVSSHCKKKKKKSTLAGKWHEELIHAGSWNASSLRFDSLWGNKMRKGGRKLMGVGCLGLVIPVSLPEVPAV